MWLLEEGHIFSMPGTIISMFGLAPTHMSLAYRDELAPPCHLPKASQAKLTPNSQLPAPSSHSDPSQVHVATFLEKLSEISGKHRDYQRYTFVWLSQESHFPEDRCHLPMFSTPALYLHISLGRDTSPSLLTP